jgi:hypothetical protein
LKATVTPVEGAAIAGDLVRSDAPAGGGNLWTFLPAPDIARASKVALAGTIEMQALSCEKAAEVKPDTPSPVSRVAFTAFDLAAASWLDTAPGQKALYDVRLLVERDHPDVSPADIKLLPHLPSAAIAPSYPTSISERQIGQVVLVVPPNDTSSVEWALTRCETIPNYRVNGDFASLQAEGVAFKVIRIGQALSCGADKLEYSMAVRSNPAVNTVPVTTTLPVRPVYHLAPVAVFGFDTTSQSTFQVREGKIVESVDRVGPGLLVGGSYFINGVDYANMRWYQHVANPFVAISLAAPKDHFVMGTTLTYRGGISAAIGVGFNHLSVLPAGYSVGQLFTGQGDIPVDKKWKYGLYVGIAVDDKLQASFKKLTKGGTGGGTAPSSPEPTSTTSGASTPPTQPAKPR